MFKKSIIALLPLISLSTMASNVELYSADGSPESAACIAAAEKGYTDKTKISCNGLEIQEFAKRMHIKLNQTPSKEVELYSADGSPESAACIAAAEKGYTDKTKISCNGLEIQEFAKRMHIKLSKNPSKETKHANTSSGAAKA